MFYKRQVRRTFKLVNPKHEDQLKIFSIFYLNNRDTRYWNMTSYNWICEDSKKKKKKKKKKKTYYKRANIFFKSVLIALFIYIYIYFLFILHIFLKVIFYYVLTCYCFAFAELKCFCASSKLICLLPNTL